MQLHLIKCHSAGEVFGMATAVDPSKLLDRKRACSLARSLCSKERSFSVDKLLLASFPEDGSVRNIRAINADGSELQTSYAAMFCASRVAMDRNSNSATNIFTAGAQQKVWRSQGFFKNIPRYQMVVPTASIHSTGVIRLGAFEVAFTDLLVNNRGVRVYSPANQDENAVQFSGVDLDVLLDLPSHAQKAAFFEIEEKSIRFFSFDASGLRLPGTLEDGIAIQTTLGMERKINISKFCYSGGFFGLNYCDESTLTEIEISVNVTKVYRADINFNGQIITGKSFSGDFLIEETRDFHKEFRSYIDFN
jgi:hypothetical protein